MESLAIFQAETQAKIVLLNWVPEPRKDDGLRSRLEELVGADFQRCHVRPFPVPHQVGPFDEVDLACGAGGGRRDNELVIHCL